MDCGQYLLRIGAVPAARRDAASLAALTRAHLIAVPFENLEPYRDKRVPSLAPEDLFRKVVTEGRGGYCFELNKLFYLLLLELGYDCCPVAARLPRPGVPDPPFSHRATVVTADGQRWFCDVGFGGPGPKGALSLDTRGEQSVYGDTFRADWEGNRCTISRKAEDGWHQTVIFRHDPAPDSDFEILNWYYGAHPDSLFTRKRVMHRTLPDGLLSLVDHRLRVLRHGVAQETELETPDELAAAEEAFFSATPLPSL